MIHIDKKTTVSDLQEIRRQVKTRRRWQRAKPSTEYFYKREIPKVRRRKKDATGQLYLIEIE